MALVLSREQNQRLFLTGDIWITVIEIRGRSVRLGITAPNHINIVREELLPPHLRHPHSDSFPKTPLTDIEAATEGGA